MEKEETEFKEKSKAKRTEKVLSLGKKGLDETLKVGEKGVDIATSAGKKGIEVTKKGVKTGGMFLGRSIVVIFLAIGLFNLILAFIGIISFEFVIGTSRYILVDDPWAIAITIALAIILSMIAVVLFSMPEGYFTKIAATGTSGLLVLLMIGALVTGILTVFALTTTIVFFSGAILIKRKFRIAAPILSLISGSLSILLTLFIIWSVFSGYVGGIMEKAGIGTVGKFVWMIGAVIMGLLGIMLLSGHLTKLKTMFVKAS